MGDDCLFCGYITISVLEQGIESESHCAHKDDILPPSHDRISVITSA